MAITPQFTEWFRDRGDQTLRVDYDLTPESIVVDLGGYKGEWASGIMRRYGCPIIVFEPIPEFMAQCVESLRGGPPNTTFYPFAIGEKNGEEEITVAADSSSIYGGGSGSPTVKITTISPKHFLSIVPPKIDLIKINIEGGEYPLLSTLLFTRDEANRFRDIQVQFHSFVEDAEMKRQTLREVLSYTHHLTYDYEFVWENWRRNGS